MDRLQRYLPYRFIKAHADAVYYCTLCRRRTSILLYPLSYDIAELERAFIKCTLLGINLEDSDAINNLDALFRHYLTQDVIVIQLQALHSIKTDAYNQASRKCEEHVNASSQKYLNEQYYIAKKALQKKRECARDEMKEAAQKLHMYCHDKTRMFDDIAISLEEAKKVKIAQGLIGCDSISEYEPPTYEHAEVYWVFREVLVKLTLVRSA